MKNLFAQIESELAHPDHQDGWCCLEKANILATTIIAIRAETVVEIGIWAGRSFLPMALTLKKLGKGKIYGIDPWKADASVQGMVGEDLKWWGSVDHERIFNVFTKWIADTGVAPFVEIHRCRNDEFDENKVGLIDLLHIDGCHGEEASNYDVEHYAKNVRVGGFLYFDDIAWAKKASLKLGGLGFKKIYTIDGGIMCQRMNYEIT